MKKLLTCLLLVLCMFTFVGLAQAQYPEKSIQVIVTYSAGGGTDVGVRVLSKYLEPIIGESLVIVNREGGGGEVGWVEIANAKNDGYTIGNFNNAAIMANAMRETMYDPLNDFEFIALNVSDPRLFAVRADDDRFKNFDDFLQYAKENPGVITMGTSGAGTTGHYSLEAFNNFADVEVTHVGFGGAGKSRAAFLGGHVDSINQTVGEVTAMVEEGTARVLVVMAEERLPQWPDVPTLKEKGIDIVFASNRGMCAPAGTPKEIIDFLSESIKQAMEDPGFLEEMGNIGLPVKYLGPEEYRANNEKEVELFKLLVSIIQG